MASPQGPEKWLVLVVHGVGESMPGQTVEAAGKAVVSVKPNLRFADREELLRLPERDDPKTDFPVVLKRDGDGGNRFVFAEVHWADLSRIRDGVQNLAVAVWRLAFGIRYVSDQAANQPGWTARYLRVVLYLAILLLRGPRLVAYVVAGTYAFLVYLSGLHAQPGAPLLLASLGLLCEAAAVVRFLRRGRNRVPFDSLTVSLTAAGLGVMLLAACGTQGWLMPVLQCLNQPPDHVLDAAMGAAMGAPGTPAFYLTALAVIATWAHNVAVFLLVAAFAGLAACCPFVKRSDRAGLAAACLSGTLQLVLWIVVVSPLVLITFAVLVRQPEMLALKEEPWTGTSCSITETCLCCCLSCCWRRRSTGSPSSFGERRTRRPVGPTGLGRFG